MKMAIKSNKKIDFEYEHENDGNTYAIPLRLYQDAIYGTAIGLLDDNGDVAVAFPVAMFSEITEFLVEQGVIENKKVPIAQPVKLPKLNKSTTSNKAISLPKPRLVSNKIKGAVVETADATSPIKVDLEQDTLDDFSEYPAEIQQQLRQEQERVANLHTAVDGLSPTLSLSENVNQLNLSEDEVQSIIQEREAAMKRAKNSERKIRKT